MNSQFKLTTEIPAYLASYVAMQDPSLYTPMDHASWRYILKISKKFFAQHAHQKYLDGLLETGISEDRIPLISEMDEKLRKFNWRAVAVVGYIPAGVFMEFLSLGILPIACDMRTIEHLAYTPSPDIVHEAAGHAPIVADPEYAAYLRSYGEISRKAIYSLEDVEVYHAIRYLSDTKENPHSSPEVIEFAQKRLDQALTGVTYVSEGTLLGRMGWWTFEYGLIGDLKDPKIFGAGLLSSLGESYRCFDSHVKKIPFSIDCIQTTYDITQPQPQLFVVPDFQTLKESLEELSEQMAFRKGGVEGLAKAKQAGTVTTTTLESGIQISGVLVDFMVDEMGSPAFIKFQGPTQICLMDHEIEGQGALHHSEGFSTPLNSITDEVLEKGGFKNGQLGRLELRGGITLEGKLVKTFKNLGELLIATFSDCTLQKGSQLLFQPEWGTFDLVSGTRIVSVFGGAADREKYLEVTGGFKQEPGTPKTNLTEKNRDLNVLYARVRQIRDLETLSLEVENELEKMNQILEKTYPQDWLLRYELLELSARLEKLPVWAKSARSNLEKMAKNSASDISETIQRGLQLLE